MPPLEPYRSYLRALDQGTAEGFLAEQPHTLKPPTDDWPFFFVLDKLGYRAANYETLFITLALLLVFSFLLMILPPFLLRRRGLSIPKSGAVVAYFASLGLGFIFVEVLFIQKLSLIVGHPSYSLAITLAALLIASGLGSLLSDKLPIRIERKAMIASISVAVLIIIANVLLASFGNLILQQTLLLRILLSSLIVAIPGFFMGMPFPSGLTLVKEVAPSFVPWGWGINATFTVIGTILGLLLAMSFGYGTVLVLAAVLYLCALGTIIIFSHKG